MDYIEGALSGELAQYAGSVYPIDIRPVCRTGFIVTTEYFAVEPDTAHHRTGCVSQSIYNPFRCVKPPLAQFQLAFRDINGMRFTHDDGSIIAVAQPPR